MVREDSGWSEKIRSDYLILLENENFENPENQPKQLASLLVLNKLIEKNGCNQDFKIRKSLHVDSQFKTLG